MKTKRLLKRGGCVEIGTEEEEFIAGALEAEKFHEDLTGNFVCASYPKEGKYHLRVPIRVKGRYEGPKEVYGRESIELGSLKHELSTGDWEEKEIHPCKIDDSDNLAMLIRYCGDRVTIDGERYCVFEPDKFAQDFYEAIKKQKDNSYLNREPPLKIQAIIPDKRSRGALRIYKPL